MSQGNKSAVIINWPKPLVRNIPPEALPSAQFARTMIELAKDAEKQRRRRARSKLMRMFEQQNHELRQQMLTAIYHVCDLGRSPVSKSKVRRKRK